MKAQQRTGALATAKPVFRPKQVRMVHAQSFA